MQNTVRILIIYDVSPRVIVGALGCDTKPSIAIGCLYHYIYVLRQLSLIRLDVVRAALFLLINHSHLVVGSIALDIIQELLEV